MVIKMGMVQSRGDTPYLFCLVIEEVLFHFLEGDYLDRDVRALHILSDEFRHPRIAGGFAQLVRIERQTFLKRLKRARSQSRNENTCLIPSSEAISAS